MLLLYLLDGAELQPSARQIGEDYFDELESGGVENLNWTLEEEDIIIPTHGIYCRWSYSIDHRIPKVGTLLSFDFANKKFAAMFMTLKKSSNMFSPIFHAIEKNLLEQVKTKSK